MQLKTRFHLMATTAWVSLLVVAIVGVINMRNAQDGLIDIGEDRLPKVAHVMDIESHIYQIRAGTYEVLSKQTLPQADQVSQLRTVAANQRAIEKEAEDLYAGYDKLPRRNPQMQAKWAEFKEIWGTWFSTMQGQTKRVEDALVNPTPESLARMHTEFAAVQDNLRRNITPKLLENVRWTTNYNQNTAKELSSKHVGEQQRAIWIQVIVSGFAIITVIVLGITTLKATFSPITTLSKMLVQTAKDRDLKQRVNYKKNDEVGEVVSSFNQLMQELQDSLKEITDRVGETTQGVEALNTAAQQVAASSASQSSSTSAMAASVEEMTVSINTVAGSAEEAQNIAHDAGETSEEGGQIIERTAAEMTSIAEVVTKAAGVIQALGEESKQISSVVQVIKEVADQTNLLALNAAIEAARAGEQGRGFAVVADEVRKLAERTTVSTGEISTMVGKIQGSAKEAVEEMSKVEQQVESGQALAQEAGERIVSIREKAHKVSDAITEISHALKEQSQASQEIAKHVESIAQMTDENNAAAEETASAAVRLEQLSSSVKNTVQQFKV